MFPNQIEALLPKQSTQYLGYFRNRFPQSLASNSCFIYSNGFHAVAISMQTDYVYHFDCNGSKPSKVVQDFLLKHVKRIKFNRKRLMSKWEFLCAYFCVHFINQVLAGFSPQQIINSLRETPDLLIRNIFKQQYNINIEEPMTYWKNYLSTYCKNCSTKCKEHGYLVIELKKNNMWLDK